MPGQLQVTGSLVYTNAAYTAPSGVFADIPFLQLTGGTTYSQGVWAAQVYISGFPLGDVTLPWYAYFRNLDKVNYVRISGNPGGVAPRFCRLMPGEWSIGPLDPDDCIPYVIANSNTCQVEYLIISR